MISPLTASKLSFMRNYAVVGHVKPDLDSTASAIATSYLADKMKTDESDKFIPYVAGDINKETEFALAYFNIKKPEVCEDFSLKVYDILKDKKAEYITLNPRDSIEEFCKIAIENNIKTLPIIEEGKLKGIVSRNDLTEFYLTKKKYVSELKKKNIPFSKIAKLLQAKVITGEENINDKIKGDVKTGAYSLETMGNNDYVKNAIVICGDREDLQLTAIKSGAQAIIITRNMPISENVIQEAKKQGTIILSTRFGVTSTIKSLEQSLPIKDIMTPVKDIIYFEEDDEVEKIKTIMQKSDHDSFPVLKHDGTFLGMIYKNDVISPEKKAFILVDHNASSQWAKGVKEGEIKGIIDHHKIDCMPEGRIDSTFGTTGANSTLIYRKFIENNIEIPDSLAGLMWLAIISDTDKLTSSTTTKSDIVAAEKLAKIAGVEEENKIIKEMFETREFNLEETPLKDIIEDDYKIIPVKDGSIFISQIKTSKPEMYIKKANEIKKILNEIDMEKNMAGSFVIITDYINKESVVYASKKSLNQAKKYFSNLDDFEPTGSPNNKTPFETLESIYSAMLKDKIFKINATSRKEQFQPFMVKIFSK